MAFLRCSPYSYALGEIVGTVADDKTSKTYIVTNGCPYLILLTIYSQSPTISISGATYTLIKNRWTNSSDGQFGRSILYLANATSNSITITSSVAMVDTYIKVDVYRYK